jgi:hypothetical protein
MKNPLAPSSCLLSFRATGLVDRNLLAGPAHWSAPSHRSPQLEHGELKPALSEAEEDLLLYTGEPRKCDAITSRTPGKHAPRSPPNPLESCAGLRTGAQNSMKCCVNR